MTPSPDEREHPDFRAIFEAAPSPNLILRADRQFTIVAANDAYLAATMTIRDGIVGKGIFEAFPDNPNDPEATGVRNIRESIEHVIAHRKPHTMAVQRYDIPRPDGDGFEERYWSPIHTPVFGPDGEVAYVIQRPEDVTEFVRLRASEGEQHRRANELRSRVDQMEAEVFQRTRELGRANDDLRRQITERERVEVALAREQDFLRAVLDNAADGIVACDGDGTLRFFNRAARDFHGMGEQPLPPDQWAQHYDLYQPDGVTAMATEQVPLYRALAEGSVKDVEMVIAAKGQPPRLLTANGRAITDGEGRKLGAVVVMHDLTARKLGEDQRQRAGREEAARKGAEASAARLAESEERLRLILESVRDHALFTTDTSGLIADWNVGAERMFGYAPDEIIGRSVAILFTEDDQLAGVPAAELEEARSTGFAEDVRWHRRKDGSRFFANGITNPLRDEAGRASGFVKVCRDETGRRLAHARQATQLAVAAVLAEAPDLDNAVPKLLQAICEASDWRWGGFWRVDETTGVLLLGNCWSAKGQSEFEEISRCMTFERGSGLPGRAWAACEPTWVADVSADENFPRREAAARAGLHGAFCFPISWRGEVLAVMEFFSNEVRAPDEPLLDMMAVIGGQIGQFIDRKTAEERLRASEARHAAGVEAALDCVVSMDHRGLVTEWNPAAERTFGYTRAEALGRELADLIIPPSLREAHRNGLARYLGTGEARVVGKRFEIAAVRKDGSEFPVELSITRLPSQGLPEFTGYLRDITEQKRAEAALRESESHARRIIDNTLAFVGVMTPDGTLTEANATALAAGGLRREDVVGKKFWECYWWSYDEELQGQLRDAVARAAGGDVVRYDATVRMAGDTRMPIDFMISPARDEQGRITHLIPSGVEIAERKRAEEERQALLESERAARAEAERASRLKDEFLATLSHELRTPLNAILGWSQILVRGKDLSKEIGDGLRTIERNARAQAQIIEDLLDMSRIISGKVRLDVRRVDLAPLLRGAVETAQPSAEAKGIRLTAVLDPLVGPVSGDPNRLQQVFWNLLTNAIKFTPKGGRVQVVLERVNSHVEASVIDTGEGIKPEFLPHVFDRFRQADGTTTRRHGGLGLGLSIVKQLVELHGGSIRVKSAGEGQGSTFVVSLPLTVIHPEHEDVGERRHPSESSSPSNVLDNCIRIAGVKVLVVDDEPDAQALVKRLLEDCGAEVVIAGTASEALGLLRTERPHVLCTDVGMPGEDGFWLIRHVRALRPEEGGGTPAIALTAYARADDRVKAMLAGFQMHLAKPIEPAELIATVAGLAGRTGKQ